MPCWLWYCCENYKCYPFVHLPLYFLQESSSHFSHHHFHFGTSTTFSKATCNTLNLLINIISLITTFPINTAILKNTILFPIILAITTTIIYIIITISFIIITIIIRFTLTINFPLSITTTKPTSSTLTPPLLHFSATLPSLPLSPSPLRKSVSCNYYCEYNSSSLQTALMIFITLLFNVVLNFQAVCFSAI